MADSIERDVSQRPDSAEAADLAEVLAWLRYRIARYRASHPPAETG